MVIESLKENKILIDTLYWVSCFLKIEEVWGREILRPSVVVKDFYISTIPDSAGNHVSAWPVEGDIVELSFFGELRERAEALPESDEDGDVRIPIGEIPNLLKRLGLKPRRAVDISNDTPKVSFCDTSDEEHAVGQEPLHRLLPSRKPEIHQLEKRVYRFLRKNFALENSPWEDGYDEQPWAIRVFPTWGFRGKRAERIIRTLEGFHDAIGAARRDSDFSEKFGVTWSCVTSWIDSAIYHTRAMQHWGPRVARPGIAF